MDHQEMADTILSPAYLLPVTMSMACLLAAKTSQEATNQKLQQIIPMLELASEEMAPPFNIVCITNTQFLKLSEEEKLVITGGNPTLASLLEKAGDGVEEWAKQIQEENVTAAGVTQLLELVKKITDILVADHCELPLVKQVLNAQEGIINFFKDR